MAGKENFDLFSQLSSNDGSLPLDFDKNTGVAGPPKEKTGKKMETSESGSVKSQPRVEKGETQRRLTHHVPPPYKKTVQEAVPLEPKNNVEMKSSVVQDKPVKNPEVEAVKDKEEANPAAVAVEAVQNPVFTDIPAPAQVEVPFSISELAAAPVPAASVVPASVPVVQAPSSLVAAQVEKSPEALSSAKRGRHPKAPHAADMAAAEKQVEPVGQAKTEPKTEVPDIKQQKISKTESLKSVKKTNATGKFSADNATAGQLLQEGRVRSGLSIDQVSISTKIKNTYIEYMERDDFGNLPASVYVNAYTRALCSLYNIDDKLVSSLLDKAKGKNHDYTVPEEVIHQLEKGKQVNVVQENKVKRMLLMGFAACFMLVACILITYYLVRVGNNPLSSTTKVKPAAYPESPVKTSVTAGTSAKILDEDMEKKLMAPHVFTMTSLPLAER